MFALEDVDWSPTRCRCSYYKTAISHWRTISRDNVTTLYGLDGNSRIADPADPQKIFSYLICRTFDDKGNIAIYEYASENDQGVDQAQAHEPIAPPPTAARSAI